MFKLKDQDIKNRQYQYMDVKIIFLLKLGNFRLIIESQLIHNHILELKAVQHKFFDVSRCNISNYRSNMLLMMSEQAEIDLKQDLIFKQDLTSYIYKKFTIGKAATEKCKELTKKCDSS